MTIERMFLAITPPPEVIDTISDLPTTAQRGVRYTKRNQWHITVRFLGECQRHHALAALEGLAATASEVTLGPSVELLGARVVMLPVTGLEAVAASVASAFAHVGETTDREFAGHLTIARLKGAPLRDPSTVTVLGAPISSTFVASTIDLYKSEVTDAGSTHTLVATQDLT